MDGIDIKIREEDLYYELFINDKLIKGLYPYELAEITEESLKLLVDLYVELAALKEAMLREDMRITANELNKALSETESLLEKAGIKVVL